MKTLTIVRTVRNIMTVYGVRECHYRDDGKMPLMRRSYTDSRRRTTSGRIRSTWQTHSRFAHNTTQRDT